MSVKGSKMSEDWLVGVLLDLQVLVQRCNMPSVKPMIDAALIAARNETLSRQQAQPSPDSKKRIELATLSPSTNKTVDLVVEAKIHPFKESPKDVVLQGPWPHTLSPI